MALSPVSSHITYVCIVLLDFALTTSPPFVLIASFFPIKKAGKRGLSLYPPVLMAWFLFSNHVPDLLLFCFKRPQIHIYPHLAPVFEALWHSPRVPANAASAKLDSAIFKYVSCLS